MPDLTDVINSSLENAGLTRDGDDDTGGTLEGTPADDTGGAPLPEGDAAPQAADGEGDAAATGDPAPEANTPDPAAAAPVAPAAPAAPAKPKGPIPYAKHEKVLANEREKHKTELAAVTQRYEAVKWAESPEAVARVRALNAAETHPELFAQAILGDAQLGPVFRKLIQGEAPAASTPAAPTGDGRPKPNVTDAEGNVGYDEAGLDALLKWTASQAEERVAKRFEEKFGKLDPIVKEHEKRQSWESDVAAADRAISHARKNWAGFADHEPEIKAFFLKPENAGKNLEAAYQAVVIPKFRADRGKIRDEVLTEMNGKARVSQPRPGSVTPAATGGGKRDLADVIHESIAGLQ